MFDVIVFKRYGGRGAKVGATANNEESDVERLLGVVQPSHVKSKMKFDKHKSGIAWQIC